MRIKDLKPYYLKPREIIRDTREGGRKETFSQTATRIEAYIYDDTQYIQPTVGGIRYSIEKIMLFAATGIVCLHGDKGSEKYSFQDSNGDVVYISAGDGICVYAPPESTPDYRVASIIHSGHLVCRLEKI